MTVVDASAKIVRINTKHAYIRLVKYNGIHPHVVEEISSLIPFRIVVRIKRTITSVVVSRFHRIRFFFDPSGEGTRAICSYIWKFVIIIFVYRASFNKQGMNKFRTSSLIELFVIIETYQALASFYTLHERNRAV